MLEVVLASDLFQTKIIFYWYDNVWQGPGTPSYHIQSLTTLLIAHVDIFDSWINLFSKLLLIVNWKRFLKEIFFWQSMVKTELRYNQCFYVKLYFDYRFKDLIFHSWILKWQGCLKWTHYDHGCLNETFCDNFGIFD